MVREPKPFHAATKPPKAGVYTARGIHDLNMLIINMAEQGFRIIAVIDTQNGDYHVVVQKLGFLRV